MKPQELRIGNWIIFDKKHNFKVDWTIIRNIQEYNTDRYDPIPLTPEILEKCGFVKGKEKGVVYHLRIDNWLSMCIDMSDYSWAFYGDGIDYETGKYLTPNTRTPHLHQLQNLYYALTGKELKVEL